MCSRLVLARLAATSVFAVPLLVECCGKAKCDWQHKPASKHIRRPEVKDCDKHQRQACSKVCRAPFMRLEG